jgi:hypothetical protein
MKGYLLQRFNHDSKEYEFLSTNGVDFFSPNEWAEDTAGYPPHFFTFDDAVEWMHRSPETSVTRCYDWY